MPELGQMYFGNKFEEHDAPDFLASDLYNLSKILGERNPEAQAHGLLGGSWGYAQDFENEVFEIHPYYWGDCECGFDDAITDWENAHEHTDACYQSELERRGGWDQAEKLATEWGLPLVGCAVHCTCGVDAEYAKWRSTHDHQPTCGIVVPNFRHKKTGFAVFWYKYIGRSMTCNREISRKEWRILITECEESLEC